MRLTCLAGGGNTSSGSKITCHAGRTIDCVGGRITSSGSKITCHVGRIMYSVRRGVYDARLIAYPISMRTYVVGWATFGTVASSFAVPGDTVYRATFWRDRCKCGHMSDKKRT